LKFGDVIVAVASLFVVGLVLNAFLLVAFGSINPNSTSDTLASIISFLVASLVVGYVFALKIQEESRIKATGVIVVLSAFALLIFVAIWMANGFAYPWMKDSINSMFNTSGWTDYDWNAYAALSASVQVIIGAVISFIGLYVGSMLRKPSAKTKE
jgi:small-conductance mechanosensitive channel